MGDHRRLLCAAEWALLAVLSTAEVSRASDCTYFVRAGFTPAAGVADGLSPERAFSTIGQGIQAVMGRGDVVCVGPGLYVEGDINLAGGNNRISEDPIEIRGDASGGSTDDPPGAVQIVPPTGLPPEQTPGAAFRLLGHQYVVIEGFEISGYRDAGIQIRSATVGLDNSSNVTIRNNVIRKCRTGIDVYAEDMIVIEGNTTIANSSSGISVQSCETSNEFGTCRAMPSGPVVPIVSNNRSGGNGAHGIFLRDGENAVVQNNVTYSNGFTGITLRGVPDALVGNNLVYRNGQEGLSIGAGFLAPGDPTDPQTLASPNAIVLNNTFFENGQWAVEIGNSLAASPGAAVVHNIAWRNGAGRNGIGVLNERGQTAIRDPSVCGYVAGFNDILDDYGPDTPHNAFDLRVDPLFVDPEGADGVAGGEIVDGQFVDRSADDDFHLRQGGGTDSPAVDAGGLLAAQIGVTGSTASNGAVDTGRADLGYHYGASVEQVLAYEPPFMPLYVRVGGQDTNGGKVPSDAFATIATAARRARAGVTVVVGPGTYRECDITSPPDSGRATFFADAAGDLTGDAPGTTLVDAGKCNFDPIGQTFSPGQTGFNISSVCGAIVNGFHVTGASDDGIQLQNQSDGAVIRNNVLFGNAKRGVNVNNSDDVQILNNLVYGNKGGIQLGSGSRTSAQCAQSGTRRAILQFNTVYRSEVDGMLIGAGACPSTDAVVRYNVTGENGTGITVGSNTTREQNLVGYHAGYNLIADRYAAGVPAGEGDRLISLANEALYLDPTGIVTTGDWRLNRSFRLAQLATGQAKQSRGVDFGDVTALKAGMSTRSTRSDGQADTGRADVGYHYPTGGTLVGDCNADGMVLVNEIVLAVNIALGNVPMSQCPAASSDGEQVTIADLIQAVNSGLGGDG
jgi:parallel beta-helix repeat protein